MLKPSVKPIRMVLSISFRPCMEPYNTNATKMNVGYYWWCLFLNTILISKHRIYVLNSFLKVKPMVKLWLLLSQVFVRESGMNNTTPLRPWTYVLIRIQDYEKGKREDSAVTFTKASRVLTLQLRRASSPQNECKVVVSEDNLSTLHRCSFYFPFN